jgi:hypothetical protein
VPPILAQAFRHPNLRFLATSRYDAYQNVLTDHPAIASMITAVDLIPPRPEEAAAMVTAHLARLQSRYGVVIEPGALAAALELWSSEKPLVLPGAALARLDRAAAWVSSIAQDDQQAQPEAGAQAVAQPQVTLPLSDPAQPRIVTADHVRRVPADLY